MIKFAVMTFMYNNWADSDAGSHEKLIEIVSDAGADGIEAFCNPFMDNSQLLQLYKEEMAAKNLEMPVMDLLANLAVSDKAARQQEYEKMKKGIDICEAFGSNIVHIAGCRLSGGEDPSDGRKYIAEGLLDFVDDIESRGMILAFEDFDPAPTLICLAEDCLEIIELTENRVKFVFDTGNFEAAGQHSEDVYEKFTDKICHFHFKDFVCDSEGKNPRGTYFGKGFVKNSVIAAKAIKNSYSGFAALESYPQDGNGPQETVAKELQILKEMFNQG